MSVCPQDPEDLARSILGICRTMGFDAEAAS